MKKFTLTFFAMCFVTIAFTQPPEIDVKKTSDLPVIDGQVDAIWTGIEKHALDNPGGGAVVLPDVNDYSCTYSVLWSGNNSENDSLYFLIELTDNVYNSDYVEGGSGDRGQDDSFDVIFNPGATATGNIGNPYRVGLVPDADGENESFWFTVNQNGSNTITEKMNKDYTVTGTKYVFEFAIGLKDFEPTASTDVGYKFGLDLRYNDDDDNNPDPNDATKTKRNGQYSWALGEDGNSGAWNEFEACGVATLSNQEVQATGITTDNIRVSTLKVAVRGDMLKVFNVDDAAAIYSVTGSKMLDIQSTEQTINISGLKNGLYILKTANNGTVKFIK